MELLNGETLADKLQRDGRLTTEEALPLARQMAAGLTAAHRAGVVHRDFKSLNVMLVKPASPDGELRASSPTSAWPSATRRTTGRVSPCP